ncbi:hypothetical protein FS837_004775, partial [Tulasnella sp. UAMH 9824]
SLEDTSAPHHAPESMDKESLVQPKRLLAFSEAAEELLGPLKVPDRPEITAGYAEIYHGVWTSPHGEQVEVAVKEFKTLIPRNRQSDMNELGKRTATVGPPASICTGISD